MGGYEIRCKNIMDALSRRGHDIRVVTSRGKGPRRRSEGDAPYPVARILYDDFYGGSVTDWLTRRRWSHVLGMMLVFTREFFFGTRDTGLVRRQIESLRPDVIYLGHTYNLSKPLLPYLSTCGVPLVYDEGGLGLIEAWEEKGIWYKLTDEYVSRHRVVQSLKSFVTEVVCRLSGRRLKPRWVWPDKMQIFFNDNLGRSKALAKGVPLNGSKVIYSGVDTELFRFRPRPGLGTTVKIVVPGGIAPHKGQLDGVRLLRKLSECNINAEMVIVGRVWSDSYYSEVANETRMLHLQDRVRFMPMIPQSELAVLYQEADICFFPSYQKAGFARVPLEAMAAGCIVISYGNEGSDEIIRDGYNGFLVPPADYARIAVIAKELMSDPARVRDMVVAARGDIEERHSMQRYIDQIEAVLIEANRGRQ